MKVAVAIVCTMTTTALGDRRSRTWLAMPPSDAATGALIRVGVGQAEQPANSEFDPSIAAMMIARLSIRALPTLQLDVSLAGELGGDSFELAAPAVAATWTSRVDALDIGLRGIVSPAITGGTTQMTSNISSTLLAHDPLVAWSAAHTLTLQASLQGRAGPLRWGIAGSVVELMPVDLPRHQTLVRADAAVAGPLGRCWTWALEIGATSDAFDEEFDERSDLVPLWSAGVHHHRGDLAIGVSTTGGWQGGSRNTLLGPSLFVDVRGPL